MARHRFGRRHRNHLTRRHRCRCRSRWRQTVRHPEAPVRLGNPLRRLRCSFHCSRCRCTQRHSQLRRLHHTRGHHKRRNRRHRNRRHPARWTTGFASGHQRHWIQNGPEVRWNSGWQRPSIRRRILRHRSRRQVHRNQQRRRIRQRRRTRRSPGRRHRSHIPTGNLWNSAPGDLGKWSHSSGNLCHWDSCAHGSRWQPVRAASARQGQLNIAWNCLVLFWVNLGLPWSRQCSGGRCQSFPVRAVAKRLRETGLIAGNSACGKASSELVSRQTGRIGEEPVCGRSFHRPYSQEN